MSALITSAGPIHFEKNLGQVSDSARYVAHIAEWVLELEDAGLTLRLPIGSGPGTRDISQTTEVRLLLKDHASNSSVVSERPQPAVASYYVGKDASKWRTHIPTCGAVRYRSIYSGVDWLVYGDGNLIAHDFILAPHGRLEQVRLAIVGAEQASLATDGSLVIASAGYEFRLRAPVACQVTADGHQPVGTRFVLDPVRREVGFAIESYPTQRLVIDPVLVFSTFFAAVRARTDATTRLLAA